MAELVKPLAYIVGRIVLCGTAALAALSVQAQGLTDPTRPPSPQGAAVPGSADAGPVLQSVLISPGRKAAIISGKEVPLNGRYGKAKLVRITETEVVLRDGGNVQVLKLFPAVEKRRTKSPRMQENG